MEQITLLKEVKQTFQFNNTFEKQTCFCNKCALFLAKRETLDLNKKLFCRILIRKLVFAEHFIESIIQLGGDGINLHLLSDNLVLKVVDSQMKLADVHLGVLRLGLRVLQPVVDDLDLLLKILSKFLKFLIFNF